MKLLDRLLRESIDRLYSQLEADYRYAGYVDRQQADIDALRRDEAVTILSLIHI